MIVTYATDYSKNIDFFYPYIKKEAVGEYAILELDIK